MALHQVQKYAHLGTSCGVAWRVVGNDAHFAMHSAKIRVFGSVRSVATTTGVNAGGVIGPRAPPMLGGVYAETASTATGNYATGVRAAVRGLGLSMVELPLCAQCPLT